MSFGGALQIGKSALTASQAAIQVAGNNMANAATVGFHRQTIHLAPARDEVIGHNARVGTGVLLQAIRREIDTALQSRYRDSVSSFSRNLVDQRFLTAIETLQNELSDNDISSLLSVFFNSFSELANNPEDSAVRDVVIQQGVSVASRIKALRADYGVVLEEIDRSLGVSIDKVNDILDQLAHINGQIVQTEGVGTPANSLRDQRDLLLDELSEFLEITAIEQPNGAVDVLVGSTPILLGTTSRGVEMRVQSVNGETEVTMRVAADGTKLTINSGTIGGLLTQRDETVRPQINRLDEFTGQLIFQVNRLHSQGQGRSGFDSVTGTYPIADAAAALNSAAANLPFDIVNGSFFIHLTHSQTGIRTAHQINIDGGTMSLNDLVNQINTVVGVPNVTAGVSVAGQFTLAADPGYEVSFSDDTSGALAALGVNTFFTGQDAADIDVNAVLQTDPNMLAAGSGHVPGSNGTALGVAELQHVKLGPLSNQSLREYWQNTINALAVKTDAANAAVESGSIVKESLAAQIQAVSGVSLDEEAINLMSYQRQFQAAARFISVIDETLQVLLSIA